MTKASSPPRDLLARLVSTADLQADSRNARLHGKAQIDALARSIERFGFNVPILADASGKVLAGHGRLAAAKKLGLGQVPVITLDHLTPAQAKAYSIADNRLGERSSWDEALLGEIFVELKELEVDFDLALTGFETPEIDQLIAGRERHGKEETEVVPEPRVGSPVTKLGDVWELGAHRVICGDSLKPESYQQLLGDIRADAVFTDPPFNVAIDGHASGKGRVRHREFPMAAGEMTSAQFEQFLTQCMGQLSAHSKPSALMYVCMDWRHLPEVLAAGQASFHELKNICVWVKDAAGMGSFYRSRHELFLVYANGPGGTQNNVQLGRFGRNRTNVWEYRSAASLSKSRIAENLLALHPTAKPTALTADALLDSTRRGDVVLDAFLGSGSTLLAAERTGRVCYGLELDPLYVDLIIERWQTATGREARHADSGNTFAKTRERRAQRATGNGQRATGNGQRATGNGQRATQRVMIND